VLRTLDREIRPVQRKNSATEKNIRPLNNLDFLKEFRMKKITFFLCLRGKNITFFGIPSISENKGAGLSGCSTFYSVPLGYAAEQSASWQQQRSNFNVPMF
jgi:hypothetical protein